MGPRRLHAADRVAEFTARGWWTADTMDALFAAQVRDRRDHVAIVDPANLMSITGASPRRLTWAELDKEVTTLAGVLLARGLRQGDVIGVELPNSVELATVYLAAWRIGLIVSPLPVQYREHEIRELAELAEMAAFITATRVSGRELAVEVLTACADVPSVRAVLVYGDDVPDGAISLSTAVGSSAEEVAEYARAHPADPNDCVTICWTSGTEGTPKGVPRTHYDWLAMSWATVDAPRLTSEAVLLNPFPMVNMAGINGMFLPWLRVGCVLVQHQPFDLKTFLGQVAAERVTYTVAQPALLTMLLQNEELLAGVDISSLRQIGSGSTPLAPSMVRGWQERGIGVINFFGSNEGIALLSDPQDIPDPEQRARFFPRYGVEGISWSSRVAGWMSVRLVDVATGEEVVTPGHPGELRIAGPTVFAGYLHGERLATPFDERGYLRTGDVFVIAGDRDQFLEHVDRAKDLIIRGGMNIAPAELEGLIAGHPAVAEVAVVGYPDEVLGERVCAIVVPRPGESPTLADLVTWLRDKRIASFKLPERLELRESLPRSPLGKVLKRELRTEIAGPVT